MTGATAAGTVGAAAAATAVSVRDATEADVPAIHAVYAHHVEHGSGSFELAPPALTEMVRRRAEIVGRGMPYLVAVGDERVLGFAYAAPYRPRAAYRYTVEDSVYVAPDAIGRGVGMVLLEALIETCTRLGFRQMVAVIGDSENLRSIRLHEKAGFAHAGTLRAVGYKFERWVDSVTMQRALGSGSNTQPPPID